MKRIIAIVAFMSIHIWMTSAVAQTCFEMRQELSRLGRGSGAVYRDGNTAMQLQGLRAEASRLRCRGLFARPDHPQRCQAIASQIGAIEQRALARVSSSADNRRRQQLIAALGSKACQDGGSLRKREDQNRDRKERFITNRKEDRVRVKRVAPEPPRLQQNALRRVERPVPLREARPEGPQRLENRRDNEPDNPPARKDRLPGSGSGQKREGRGKTEFRTLCVRLCDGYYFPLSFGRSKQSFAREETQCQARCPGAQMRLYYQSLAKDSDEEILSARDDSSYEALDTAFLYRTHRPAQCRCSITGVERDLSELSSDPETTLSLVGKHGLAKDGIDGLRASDEDKPDGASFARAGNQGLESLSMPQYAYVRINAINQPPVSLSGSSGQGVHGLRGPRGPLAPGRPLDQAEQSNIATRSGIADGRGEAGLQKSVRFVGPVPPFEATYRPVSVRGAVNDGGEGSEERLEGLPWPARMISRFLLLLDMMRAKE